LLLTALFLFTVASVLCGVAPALWLLIAAQAAQGLGAAIMMALSMESIGETVLKDKSGNVMGLLGTMSALGTALSPSLGGRPDR
jgi:MFS family permease